MGVYPSCRNFLFPRCEETKNIEKGELWPVPLFSYCNQIEQCFYHPKEHSSTRIVAQNVFAQKVGLKHERLRSLYLADTPYPAIFDFGVKQPSLYQRTAALSARTLRKQARACSFPSASLTLLCHIKEVMCHKKEERRRSIFPILRLDSIV